MGSSWHAWSGSEATWQVAHNVSASMDLCLDYWQSNLPDKLSSKFKVLSDFLVSSRLKLNDDKTHLLVLTTSQKRKKRGANLGVVISTPSATVTPTPAEKLLGGWIHQDLKWAEHIQDNDESLIRGLTTRLSALKIIGKVATFSTRKMIADGIFISKLSYLISLWGGCEGYLLKSLQVIQNKAARVVTKLDWNTPTRVLLSQCGWLSVCQLAMYHTVLLVHKTLQTGAPEYLHSMYSRHYQVKTRLADKGLIKPSETDAPKKDLTQDSFKWRSLHQYNLLPLEIRSATSINKFKKLAKNWIMENIPIVWDELARWCLPPPSYQMGGSLHQDKVILKYYLSLERKVIITYSESK